MLHRHFGVDMQCFVSQIKSQICSLSVKRYWDIYRTIKLSLRFSILCLRIFTCPLFVVSMWSNGSEFPGVCTVPDARLCNFLTHVSRNPSALFSVLRASRTIFRSLLKYLLNTSLCSLTEFCCKESCIFFSLQECSPNPHSDWLELLTSINLFSRGNYPSFTHFSNNGLNFLRHCSIMMK